jgi:hypothetical protein
MIDFKNITIVSMDVNTRDYPDFCGSYIIEAEWSDTGKELTEEEIDDLNDNHYDFVYECVWDYLY